jgi:Tol biopolymer transport system component
MKSQRWRKIEELYHAAQARSANERGAFLTEACQGDAELRSQIEALLAQDEGDKILDGPAAELLTASIDQGGRSLSAGDQIGPYKIVGLIGAGGMGEVYRARDPRLRRDVALKVLPAEVSHDPVRRQRFEREARTVAALNHPNIVSVHDVGEDQGVYFIVTELVDGEPLSAAHLGLRKTLDIAVQIASGLAAAHEAGIVHRDLKPANILLTRDGQVKILDFGLAKLCGTAPDGSTKSDTLKTQPGIIMGTPSYMSPEQVKAEPIDHRSDIFSFGVILYELLAGHRAFQGITAEVMAAILNTDLPELPETVPSGVRRIVAHCLEKDPAKRFQSAGDLKFALTEVAQGSGSGSLSPARALGGHGKWAWIVSAVMSLAAAAFAFAYFTRNTPEATIRFSFAPPFQTDGIRVAVSPDGTRIAFSDALGRSAIWLRSVESFGIQKLAGTEGAWSPFWSPDGRSLGYISGRRGVQRIDFSGGQTAAQTMTSSASVSLGGAWSPQGIILYSEFAGSVLYRVPASGGSPTPATRLNPARKEIAHRYPQFLPDGRHFIYWVWSTLDENTGEYVGSLDPEEKLPDGPLVRTWREAHYTGPGYLLFLQGSTLVARRFDAARQRFTGEPRQLSEQVGVYWPTKGEALFSTSATGALVYQEFLPQPKASIVLRDRTGNQLRTFEAPSRSGNPTLDPLEKRVVVGGLDADNQQVELWSVDLERGIRSRLTAGHSVSETPIWSPDGERIAFRSNRSGAYDLYATNANGTGDDELLVKSSHTKTPTDWSKDGQFLVYWEIDPVTKSDIWVLRLKGDRKAIPFLKTEFNESWGKLSPVPDRQGHLWMAYTSDETGSYQIYIRPFVPDAPVSPAGTKVRVSAEGVADYCWRKDGKELFYIDDQGKVMAVDVKLGSIAEVGTPRKVFDLPPGYSGFITPGFSGFTAFGDGQRFLFIEPAGEPPAPKINVVLNWAAGLKR